MNGISARQKGLLCLGAAASAIAAIALATVSPLLVWRGAVYTIACFAGIVALCMLLLQPLLIAGAVPGFSGYRGRRLHFWTGLTLAAAIAVHVAGLWITSPPDMLDALLFASPTLFSPWGVLAMWAIFAASLMAMLRRRLPIAPRTWRGIHQMLAAFIVAASVAHALLLEGLMEPVSKAVLCALTFVAAAAAIINRRIRHKRGAA